MYEIKSSKKMYSGKIFDIYQDEIELPNGNIASRDSLIHNGAAAVLPIDEKGNIILVRQYRHSVLDYVLEIPAGKLEKDEDPKVCAIRELEEEIGYISSDFSYMFKTYIAVGYSSEVIHIYLAKDLKKTVQNLDDDEFLEIETYTLDECMTMIQNGNILDSKTIATLLFYKQLIV
ncbi:MAG: NUDIX domain-containing protein [Lachnospirales bacterium]